MAKRDTDHTDLGEQFGNERDGAYDKLKAKQEGSAKAKGVLAGAGYARGGGVSPIRAKKIADKEVHKHEKADHKGHKLTKLKHGGKIDGKKAHHRADKFARGGSVPKGHHTKININMGASTADKQEAMKKGVLMGAQMAAQKMAPPPAAPGGMPGGGPQGAPPTMGAKHGGRTYAKGGKVGPVKVAGVPHLTGGAGGGLGRREKMKSYGSKPKK